MIRAEAPRVTSKPFKTSHEEQIKLVSSFDWIDWDALADLDELFRSVTEGSLFIDDARRTAIGAALTYRQTSHTQAKQNKKLIFLVFIGETAQIGQSPFLCG